MSQAAAPFAPFHLEHVVAQQHRGGDAPSNLAFACHRCNCFKGTNLTGIDPTSRKITRLFHPRRHKWSRHFEWSGAILIGKTAIGRTTVVVLQINDPESVREREEIMAECLFDFD